MFNFKIWILAVFAGVFMSGCQHFGKAQQALSIAATREAERYPWAVYPIKEESKRKICDALQLPQHDIFCQPGNPVDHWDVYEKIVEVFPPGRTAYREVELALGEFPHVTEEARLPDGTLTSLTYVYQLTEYEGACVYFDIDDSLTTIEKISATKRDILSPQRTKCGPADHTN